MINRLSRITKLQRMKKKKKKKQILSLLFIFKKLCKIIWIANVLFNGRGRRNADGGYSRNERRTCDTVLAIARKRWCFRKSKAGQPLTCGHPPDLHTIHLSLSLLLPSIFRSVGRARGRRSSRSPSQKISSVVRSSWYLTTAQPHGIT